MRVSILGGEDGHRGWFGGTFTTTRWVILGVAIATGLALTVIFLPWGAFSLLILPPGAYLVTMPTANNTLLARYLAKKRWRSRTKTGTDLYRPYDAAGWVELNETAATATTRTDRKHAMRQLASMRAVPDGVVGMSWLQSGVRIPGIQWHQEPYRDGYLAVTFATDGQIAGIDTDDAFDHAQAGFGKFLATFGREQSLATRVQSIARVLPADSATHEAWLRSRLDSKVPALVALSYRQVIDRLRGQLVQSDFFTISWPITPQFIAKASRVGEGTDGWRALMVAEIRQTVSQLVAAGFLNVRALTARQTMAVIRHLQHPDYDINKVSDLTPATGWLPSSDAYSYTTYLADIDGELRQALTRTAPITAGNVETAERNWLWLNPLLTRMDRQIVRTISFHHEIVPQAEARAAAEEDVTSDGAEQLRRRQAGILEDAVIDVAKTAGQRRLNDLAPSSGIHGDNWVGYLTVTAATPELLLEACEAASDAAGQAGITRLEWCDTYQAAANATTWPVGRGISTRARSASEKVTTLLAGHGPKDAL